MKGAFHLNSTTGISDLDQNRVARLSNLTAAVLGLFVAAFFLIWTAPTAVAQVKIELQAEIPRPAPSGEKDETPEDPKTLEERKQALFKQSSEAFLKRSGHLEYLRSTAEVIKKSLELDEKRQEKLEQLVESTFDELIELGIPAIAEQFSRYSESYQEGRLATSRGALRSISVSSMPDLPDPLETEVWKKGVSDLLSPDEAKAWKHNLSQRQEKQRNEDIKSLEEILEFREERDEKYLKTWVDQRVARIVADLSLPKEKEKVILATGKSFLEDSVDSIAASSIEEIKKATPLERRRILKMAPSRSPIHIRPEQESEELWQAAISKHLAPEEVERLKKFEEKRRERNIEAVSLVAFHSLDRYLRFGLEQEAQVLPLLRSRVRERVRQYSRPHHPALSMSLLASDLRKDEVREKLEAVLSPMQRETLSLFLESFGYFSTTLNFEEDSEADPSLELTPAAATERFVGIYMKERLDWERQRRLIPLRSRISEMDREIGLSDTEKLELEIAAKGAVTREIEPLDERLPASVRSQIERSLKAGKKEQRLQVHMNLQSDHITAEETEIWNDTVTSILSDEEKKSLQEIESQRVESEIAAYVEMALSEIDSSLFISDEQSKQLRPLLEEGFAEYLPYLKRSQIYSRNWFEFYSGGTIVSFKMIPKGKMQSIFSKEQLEIWDMKYERRVKSSWDRLQQIRNREKKEEKQEQGE